MDQPHEHLNLESLICQVERLDSSVLVVSYDRESDTLMVHFYGRGVPGVSDPLTDEFMLRLDRDRKRVIGVQIERFLSRVVHDHPRLLDLLDIADLRGITLEEVARLRRETAQHRKQSTITTMLAEVPAFSSAAD